MVFVNTSQCDGADSTLGINSRDKFRFCKPSELILMLPVMIMIIIIFRRS